MIALTLIIQLQLSLCEIKFITSVIETLLLKVFMENKFIRTR